MNPVPVTALQEGARYPAPLYVDGSVFLRPNVEITQKDLDTLKNLGVIEVFTDAPPPANTVDTPPPPEAPLPSAVQPAAESGANSVFYRLGEEIKLLKNVFNTIGAKNAIKPRIIWTIVATLLQLLKRDKNGCIEFVLCNNIRSNDLAKSSVNIGILTALIAIEKGISDQVVPELVSAALLHDTGMLRLPKALLEKKTPLTDEEKKLIQQHVVFSYHIVKDELHYPASIAAAVLQHHERWDGMGYPQGIAGNNIDKGACIIAIADSFEALVSIKPYRNSMNAYHAMKTMMSENLSHFSPRVMQDFVKIMGIYPIGSGVILNNGAYARVQDVNKDAPLRPIVKITANSSGDPAPDGEIIDLLSVKNLYITQIYDSGKAR
ncbi:MAG: HD-GYP domain-containing protein [Spirochaetaceae bacterium]|jgi:HD-GYP domain-containing protein (c-di-GMP phosphodiesterase class II)|nr:HD-GYP domain-containing protein [Spirochaetaceae bacterium]